MIKKISPVFVVVAMLSACGGGGNSSSEPPFSKAIDNPDSTLVYISKQEIACKSLGLPMSETAKALIEDGIDVIDSECGRKIKNSFVIECGVETTAINIHEIPEANLVDAEAIGYASIHDLAEEGLGSGFIVEECAAD